MVSGDSNSHRMNRRTALTTLGTTGAVVLAGCANQGNGSDGGAARFIISGNDIPDKMGLDGIAPRTTLPMAEILNEEASDLFDVQLRIESQLCGEQACVPKIVNNNIQAANLSIANSTAHWPSNVLWTLPYTFTNGLEASFIWTKQKSWEDYWVPFGKQHGVIPITAAAMTERQIYIGTNKHQENGEARLRVPSDIEDYEIRRTKSPASALSLRQWGTVPQDVSWGDTLQGMRSGVVDGMESATAASLAFGMGESIGQIIKNNWSVAGEVLWANVDWLKGLSEDQRQALANATKEATNSVMRTYKDHMMNDIGEQQDPPEGSVLAENDVMVTEPSEDEMEEWINPVDPKSNPGLYEDIIGNVNIGGQEFYDYLYETSRSSDITSNHEDYSPETWWNDHLDSI